MTDSTSAGSSKERLRELRKTVEHYARTERDRASDETVAELFEVAALLQSLESSDETVDVADVWAKTAGQLASDAERYRFLRQPGNAIVYAKDRNAWGDGASGHIKYETAEQLDAAIDKARGELKAFAGRSGIQGPGDEDQNSRPAPSEKALHEQFPVQGGDVVPPSQPKPYKPL